MFFTYTPGDGDAQEWWFDPTTMRAQEAEAIERRTGWDWSEFGMHLMRGSVLARRALLWTYLRRVHHVLRFEDVDFAVSEVELEFSADELRRMRDEAANSTQGTDADRVAALAAIDEQLGQARSGPGKAPASTDG